MPTIRPFDRRLDAHKLLRHVAFLQVAFTNVEAWSYFDHPTLDPEILHDCVSLGGLKAPKILAKERRLKKGVGEDEMVSSGRGERLGRGRSGEVDKGG